MQRLNFTCLVKINYFLHDIKIFFNFADLRQYDTEYEQKYVFESYYLHEMNIVPLFLMIFLILAEILLGTS